VHAVLGELPGGEERALASRPRFDTQTCTGYSSQKRGRWVPAPFDGSTVASQPALQWVAI
jgi:hypothetical protein